MLYSAEEYLDYVIELDKQAEGRDNIFVYKGYVDQEVSKFFANQVKARLDAEGMDYLLANRIYHIMVECFQNIIRHSAARPEGNPENEISKIRGYLSVSKSDDFFMVTTGNSIEDEATKNLSAWLDKINALEQDELKKLYKEILRENKLNNRGGAGLGFVDMKKRTKNKIDYRICPLNEDNKFLILNVKIRGN